MHVMLGGGVCRGDTHPITEYQSSIKDIFSDKWHPKLRNPGGVCNVFKAKGGRGGNFSVLLPNMCFKKWFRRLPSAVPHDIRLLRQSNSLYYIYIYIYT